MTGEFADVFGESILIVGRFGMQKTRTKARAKARAKAKEKEKENAEAQRTQRERGEKQKARTEVRAFPSIGSHYGLSKDRPCRKFALAAPRR